MTALRAVSDAAEKSRICAAITKTLPEWFGQPASNEAYRQGIAETWVCAAFDGAQPVGALSLRFHFEHTAEIWWMGVARAHHRQGIGRALMARGLAHASNAGARHAVLMTLSPRSRDQGYAATRRFYHEMGFVPLVAFQEDDPVHPMMWMLRSL